MTSYSLGHLADETLLHNLHALIARDRITTAQILAHLSEVDERRLYASVGYSSMYAYCVGELRFSEEAAYKRIHAARAARSFPEIFAAIADGRLHLSAVILLAPHLTSENAGELLALASERTKSQIEQFLADRAPRPIVPAKIEALAQPAVQVVMADEHAPGRVEAPATPAPANQPSRSTVAALGCKRFAIQFTIDEGTKEKMHQAQALFSHRIHTSDLAGLFSRALDALIREGEKRKFAKTDRPRPSAPASIHPRHIPAHVKRAVWQRDRGECTFVSANGHRCSSRKRLEFDHVHPVARGGETKIDNLRLRCRAHNQHVAERIFGMEFMSRKRKEARRAAGANASGDRQPALRSSAPLL